MSSLHLPYTSPASPLHLPHISPASPLDLPNLPERDEGGHDKLLELELARELAYLRRGRCSEM